MNEHKQSDVGQQAAGHSEHGRDERKKDALAEHILRAAGLSSDDLVAFQPVFRDAVANLASRIAPLSSTKPFADLVALETLKTADFATLLEEDSLVARFEAPRWGGDVLLVLEGGLVSLMTDAFFGASEPVGSHRSGREFSAVEISIGESLSLHMAHAMDDVFGNGDAQLFHLKRIVPAARFDGQEFAKMRMFSCQITIGFGEAHATMRVLMPRSCHRPIQEAVMRVLRAPSNQADPLWARRLRQEVSRAHVTIEAYITQSSMSLAKLSHLEVGQVLPLPANIMNEVKLRSGDKPIYKCSLGKIGQNFSARVNEPVDEEEEMIDGLVADQ